MPKKKHVNQSIICANVNCKYNNAHFECAYDGTIRLNYEHVNTVNDGNRSFLTCQSFKFGPQTKMIRLKDVERPLIGMHPRADGKSLTHLAQFLEQVSAAKEAKNDRERS